MLDSYSFPFGLFFILLFVVCGMYVHFRGNVRHRPMRQLFDHSTFMAPVNCFLYLFSKLPAKPYYSPDDFPELKLLRDNWKVIREEALNLNANQQIKASDDLDDAGFNSFFRTGWKRFHLKWYGNDLKSAMLSCPETVSLLNKVPNIKAAMFASLPPGAKLQQHRDPYAGSLRYHLALVAPGRPECSIYVDGQSYFWKPGEDVLFDETYIHYAHNETNEQRIVLFCDVVRPLWFAPARWFNRLFSRFVMGAAVSKNTAGDKVGFINKLFGQVYVVRQVGKKIKAKSRFVYYALKYLIFALLIYFIFF